MEPDESVDSDGSAEEIKRLPTGSIERIIFKDFLTYENATLIAGRNLNVIIGVNGSGKSTIICGICLVVGGSPKHLGRSESIGDFVRHGKELASVELHIADERKGTQRFRLVIIRNDRYEKGHATHFFNGQKSTNRDVRAIAIDVYNIQIDNPCTFLAQDKVKSFSEQNPQQLLQNTEKAGDSRLFDRHWELIQERIQHKHQDEAKGNIEKEVQDVKADMDRLRPLVENYQRQEIQNSKINALSKRLKFMEFEIASKDARKREAHFKRIQKKERVAEAELKDAQKKDEELRNRLDNITRQTDPIKRRIYELEANLRDGLRVNHYDRQMDKHKKELEYEMRGYETFENEVQELREKIAQLQQRHAMNRQESTENQEERAARTTALASEKVRIQNESYRIDDQIRDLEMMMRRLYHERRGLQYNLTNRRSPYEDKIQLMTNFGPDFTFASQAWTFLENDDSGISVNVPFFNMVIHKENARYIEGLVSHRDMLMFIFEKKEDERKIAGRFPKIHTTVMSEEQVDISQIKAQISSRMQELGFDCFAVNLIEQAPGVVLQYLCNVSGLGRIPISKRGLRDSRTLTDDLYSLGITRYVVQQQLSDLKRSKYGNREAITSSRQLRDPRFLLRHEKAVQAGGVDHQRRDFEEREHRCEASLADLKDKKEALKKEFADVQREYNDLRANSGREEDLLLHLQHYKGKLRAKEQNKPDIPYAKAKFEQDKKNVAIDTLRRVGELIRIAEQRSDQKQEAQYVALSVDPVRKRKRECYDLFLKKYNYHKQLELATRRRENAWRDAQEKIKAATEDLQNHCNIPGTTKTGMNKAQKEALEKLIEGFETHGLLGKTADDIQEQLTVEEAKKKVRRDDGTADDVKKYTAFEKQLKTLEASLAERTSDVEARTAVLQAEIDKWKEPVQELIQKINANYQKFFDEIGCIGEVELEIPKDPLDVADYGIMIMVSFRRNEKVRRLDHQVQSGGERSVSTMLYLLALQELCSVPFRCVDEINQGMDPVNERKVFEIMVNTLTGCGNLAKTQYFLLTPKLLNDLPYNSKVTIQCVMNSRAIPKNSHKWNPYDILRSLRR